VVGHNAPTALFAEAGGRDAGKLPEAVDLLREKRGSV